MDGQISRQAQAKTASVINILVGLWLVISPWVFGFSGAPGATGMWNLVIVGLLIALFAAVRGFGAVEDAWPSWINMALGVWVIASPWIYGYADTPSRMWNGIVAGLVVATLSLWSVLSSSTRRTTTA